MRSSSIKSAALALSILASVSVAVPSAEARPAKTREAVTSRGDSRDFTQVVRRFVNRMTRGVVTNGWPTIPIPDDTPAPTGGK